VGELKLHREIYSDELNQRLDQAFSALADLSPLPPGPRRRVRVPIHELPSGAPSLLAAYGKKRAGKTTVADFLAIHYRDVVEIAFSAPMITEVNEYLATSGHFITDHNKANKHYRYLLQVWAEARRAEKEDYWTSQLLERAKAEIAKGARMVIASGLRQPDEMEAFFSAGGEVWKVLRIPSCPECECRAEEAHQQGCTLAETWPASSPESDPLTDLHYNEIALDMTPDEKFSLVIENDGDLLALCSKAITAVSLERDGRHHLGRL
jgi:hypothetical protein